ncbi:hypothetical protein [Crenothrix polyspora]|uniref:Uncharacterized protein n=1 Tax=Crenothrix polyspora TaxID=360316 RepID=A0A1R4H448_9GAMM|nr:hypothetical protein [Crenothrix polyspora]SJM90801.1 conserved hypothetical protein [Crenothrix polyspora]
MDVNSLKCTTISNLFISHIIKSTSKIIVGLTLRALLVACSEYQPINRPNATLVKPRSQIKPNYIPHPLGERTVEDIMQIYGTHVTRKLNNYFTKAKVSFPPKAPWSP